MIVLWYDSVIYDDNNNNNNIARGRICVVIGLKYLKRH